MNEKPADSPFRSVSESHQEARAGERESSSAGVLFSFVRGSRSLHRSPAVYVRKDEIQPLEIVHGGLHRSAKNETNEVSEESFRDRSASE